MGNILFIGEETESYPYRLLGLETLVPPGDWEDLSWVDTAARGEHAVVLVAEGTLRRRGEAVALLLERLGKRAALTVVPDLARERSEHLRFIRRATVRALGVDTWTADEDMRTGATS